MGPATLGKPSAMRLTWCVQVSGHPSSRRRIACQRGQDTIEWAAVLVVVALLIAAVATLVPQLGATLGHDVDCLIAKIFGGGCAAGPRYPVGVSTKTVGYNGRVAIVDGSHGYTVTLTKYNNGTSTITVVNTGKLGVSGRLGATAELGPLGGAQADASIGGGAYGDQTTTWTFPSWSQGQQSYNKISQGSGLGLAGHDAVSSTLGGLPLVGSKITGLFDDLTGAQGSPGAGSLPKQYISSTAVGGGAQGSGQANAGLSLATLNIASVGASFNANAGVEHITSGPQNGDNQLVVGIKGNANGSLVGALFGGQANAAGNVNGQATVTFSPDGRPLTLQVAVSGDGVWGVTPPGNISARTLKEPDGNGGSKPPVLSVDSRGSTGNGVGTSFVGTLNLSTDPQAVADLQRTLQDPSSIGALVGDMNSNGTESVQTYTINRSNTTYAVGINAGAGFGAGTTDGSSTATYNAPKTRRDGGPWQNSSS